MYPILSHPVLTCIPSLPLSYSILILNAPCSLCPPMPPPPPPPPSCLVVVGVQIYDFLKLSPFLPICLPFFVMSVPPPSGTVLCVMICASPSDVVTYPCHCSYPLLTMVRLSCDPAFQLTFWRNATFSFPVALCRPLQLMLGSEKMK